MNKKLLCYIIMAIKKERKKFITALNEKQINEIILETLVYIIEEYNYDNVNNEHELTKQQWDLLVKEQELNCITSILEQLDKKRLFKEDRLEVLEVYYKISEYLEPS
jgi:hypothetical protein